MLRTFLSVLSGIIVLCGLTANHISAQQRPCIVYILADDMGYGDVQCLNPDRGRIRTPHLDRLASEGMTFTDAHSSSSVCTPTRYGLLTGRYAWRTRLQQGVLDGGNDEPLIAVDRLTVAGFLRQQGYTTACIGKWHLGFQSNGVPEKRSRNEKEKGKADEKEDFGRGGLPVGTKILGGPTTRGFDQFYGVSNARTMASLVEQDQVVEAQDPIEMLPKLGQRAAGYVRQHAAYAKAGKPFFLYVPLTSPHTPILPTPEWRGKSGLGDYGDFVMMTDAIVGEILTAMDETGLTENALVFFTADNGCSPQAGTKRLEEQGHFASGQFRGYKADIWEGGHRVPFFARWPGRIAAGSRCDQTICHTDLIATCSDLLKVRLPENVGEDSVSILPALLQTTDKPLRDSVIHHSIQGRFAIRQGPWKLNFCSGSGGWAEPGDKAATAQGLPALQLYHLGEDITESVNRQHSEPEVVTRLTEVLRKSIADGRTTPGVPQQNDIEVRSPF